MAWGRLALLQAADDEHALGKLAEVFGYAKIPDEQTVGHIVGYGLNVEPTITMTSEPTDTVPKLPPARFLRVNKIVNVETGRNDLQKPGYLSDPAMRLQASDAPTGTYRFAAPVPLMPMARLLPFLFNGLAQAKSGQSLDHRLLLRRIEQGRALQRLPKQQRRRWPQRLQIIVDASQRLEPYWADFEFIVRRLQTLLGKEAVEALRFDEDTLGSEACYCLPWPRADHDHWRLWQTPPPDVAILILGDLGVGDSRAAVGWQRQLACLQQRTSLLTLSPAFSSPGDKPYCHPLRPNPFNDHYPLPRHPSRHGFAYSEPSPQAIDGILTWLAPLPLIDAGLLRRLRVEMQWGNSALEAVIWNHPHVRDIGLGICLHHHVAQHYQQHFQQNVADSEASTRFWRIVEQHHAGAYQGLRQLEKFKLCFFEQQDEPAMREYFQRLCASVMQSGNDPVQQRALRLQCRTVLASLPEAIWNSGLQDLAYPLYAAGYEDEIRAGRWPEKLPAGFNPDRLQWLNPSAAQIKQRWRIVQIGGQGQMQCEPHSEDVEVIRPVAELDVSQGFPPRLTLTASAEPVTLIPANGFTVNLPENVTAIVEAGALKLELDAIRRPSWASRIWRDADGLWAGIPWLNQESKVFWQVSKTEADGTWLWPAPFGEDSFGLYADLSVKHVTQRFRWIEPGAFWMGSPESELEREWGGMDKFKGSETLHPVTLTQGFWLADTAVSQAFWQVVMSANPSHFKDSPDNPVEQVSWHDAQDFIDKLNNLFPGLQAKLPSEAQWEYACRAGTAAPFSFGVNITPEQVNYYGNSPYANGEKGLYRQRTVPGKSLPANPWGLYEMNGNVWEWCIDVWKQRLSADPVIDPVVTKADGDSARVVRGGSWLNYGGHVRSAMRNREAPDGRSGNLGFRLALGHAELRPGQGGGTTEQEAGTGEGTGRHVAEHRQTVPSPTADGEPASKLVKQPKKLSGKGVKKKK